ncbi:hypothetical protein CQ12_37450 [Bradyrhizobium jicamae]|uniref:Uncharacterized protein n=1 Tax=Bradyrhizobium jicamae TaxID=280332 RepID=A0A0R3KI69_9BRAD|nr:hypothetical protein [Bradyrhizobium jicamae]KRQ94509.1 hypothetical protein CQ12_37450 [Bradyrhizobium jicamae]
MAGVLYVGAVLAEDRFFGWLAGMAIGGIALVFQMSDDSKCRTWNPGFPRCAIAYLKFAQTRALKDC